MKPKSNIVKPCTPSGFPEYLPEDQIAFNRYLDIIRNTYEKYGFAPLDTPDAELKEVLLAKTAGETEKQVYSLINGTAEESQSSDKLCLRFDLTVPLARYAAQHYNDLIFPFRRYHIGKVHRGERNQAGRFREFYQCDIDVLGSSNPIIDAEFPAIINDIFTQFDFGPFVIRINDRRILNGFFAFIGLADKKEATMRLVDKMEKMPLSEFKQALEALGLSDQQISHIINLTNITGTNDEVLDRLANLGIDDPDFIAGLTNLRAVISAVRMFKVPEKNFIVDLKIARGLDYYTGTVYETVLVDHPSLGSVCGGGRFDDLAGHYTKVNIPGVGISIGLSRLFYKLRELGIIKSEQKSPAKVIILPMSEPEFDFAATIAANLRATGVPTLLYTELQKFSKKMSYANKMGFPFCIIIGPDEAAAGKVTVKNMQTGKATTVTPGQALDIIS